MLTIREAAKLKQHTPFNPTSGVWARYPTSYLCGVEMLFPIDFQLKRNVFKAGFHKKYNSK